jgi:serine/threonine-protein kinase
MALTTRVWSAGKFFVLAGALLATFVLFFAVSMRIALKTREVVVPNLIGQTVNDGTRLLAEEGLTLRVEQNRRLDPKIPAGRVVAQEPPAGTTTRSQRTVKAWLSDGATASVVPQLVGESERTAQIRAQMASLRLAAVAEIRSADVAAGVVVAQNPPPKSRAASVSLLVNRGERGRTYVMPDLIGVDAGQAADLLRSRGLRVAVVGGQPYPGVRPGIVIRQTPDGGFQVAPGDAISLEVSR